MRCAQVLREIRAALGSDAGPPAQCPYQTRRPNTKVPWSVLQIALDQKVVVRIQPPQPRPRSAGDLFLA
jgi:hypothetical protein